MTTSKASGGNWTIACFIVRWILGVLFLMAGWWKVFELSAVSHAQRFFLATYQDGFSYVQGTWLPEWLLWAVGVTIPYVELAAGLLLCAGLRIRETLVVLGGLLIVTTYGHALHAPLFDISGHTFTRLALIVFLLLAPRGCDKLSADHWLSRRFDAARA